MMSPRSFLVTRQNHIVHTHAPQAQPHRRNSASTPSPVATTPDTTTKPKDETSSRTATDSTPSASPLGVPMPSAKRKDAERLSPTPSPPRTTLSITRTTGTTSPVQIPVKKSEPSRPPQKLPRHRGERRPHHHAHTRARDAHNPDAVPPAVAALLAITNIPPQRSTRSLRRGSPGDEQRMTMHAIIERQQEAEKEMSWNLSKSPMDFLLTPPEELDEDAFSMDDSAMGSLLSTRTISLESMPSLLDSSMPGTVSSTDSLQTPARGRKIQPTRRSLTPVSPPPGDILLDHPLSDSSMDVNELDFRVFESSPSPSEKKRALNPIKSAFKSNLTASLRALRNAARSFSNLNLTSIPPEDFLTRSILTLDPRIPYTDERRPPPLEAEPSEALRRYLNPTTARLEPLPASTPSPTTKVFTASIQMQTYRVHRARSAPPTSRTPVTTQPGASSSPQSNPVAPESSTPGPRQRELRENSDFIRIAVMEMAMRKKGKLDDRKPGRARLALPPRKTSGRPYEVGADGVPVRWRSLSYP